MKVFGYCRVSGKGQLEGDGFGRQEEAIRTFCTNQGHTIEHVYKEQVSGTSEGEGREQFTAMVETILKNGVRTIVVESLDRLAREYRIQEQLIIYLTSKDITLIVANTGENVTEAISADPMRKALVQMQGIFAELDRSLLVKKIRKARERKRQETGRCEGAKPYYAGTDIVKTIKKLRRKRKGLKRVTYAQVAEKLNEMDIKTAKGQPFNSASVRAIVSRAARV